MTLLCAMTGQSELKYPGYLGTYRGPTEGGQVYQLGFSN